MEIILLIFIFVAIASISAAVWSVWLAAFRPAYLGMLVGLSRSRIDLPPRGFGVAFMIAAGIGWLTIYYGGIHAGLAWMPSSWGFVEDGSYKTIREVVAGVAAGFGLICNIALLEKVVTNTDQIESLKHRLDASEKQFDKLRKIH